MIKNTYFRIIITIVILIGIILVSESFINKYVYERGKPINKVVIPDIIQENIPKIPYLDVISDLFVSFINTLYCIL